MGFWLTSLHLAIALLFVGTGCGGPTASPTSSSLFSKRNALTSGLASATSRTFRKDGVVQLNGRSAFFFGMYHVSWSAKSKSQILSHFDEIAAAGFNGVHCSENPYMSTTELLDAAKARGLAVVLEGTDSGMVNRVKQFKDHSAIFAWNIGDDVHDKYSVSELTSRHNSIKQVDPNRPTYLTVYDPEKWGPYLSISDVVAPYSYPIGWGGVSEVMSTLSQATSGHPLWGIPQAYKWSWSTTVQTSIQTRNMIYQNVILGAKSLMPYNFYEVLNGVEFNLLNYPQIWNELKAVVPEIYQLAPALLDGQYTRLATNTNGVASAQWIYEGRLYLILANLSTGSRSVNLTLDTTGLSGFRSLFANRPSGLTFSNRIVSGSMTAESVHVYTLDIGQASTPSPTPVASPSPTPIASPSPSPSPSPVVSPQPNPTPAPSPSPSPTPRKRRTRR